MGIYPSTKGKGREGRWRADQGEDGGGKIGKETGKGNGKKGFFAHAVGHAVKHALGWVGLPVPREDDGCDSDIE